MTLPRQMTRHHPALEVVAQFLLILGAAIVYFAVRGITEGSEAESLANARRVLDVEQSMGMAVEATAQSWILDSRLLVTLANWVYIWGHWPVLGTTLFVLHRRRSPQYVLLRNAMFVSGAIGIIVFMTFPVAPPRLLDPVYVDTVSDLSTSYRVFQPPGLVNEFAAMPSLHVGWNLLAGIAIIRSSRSWWARLVGMAGPIVMTMAVVLTANHYALDAVAGAVVALIGLVGAHHLWGRFYEGRMSTDSEVTVDLCDGAEGFAGRPAAPEAQRFERPVQTGGAPTSRPVRSAVMRRAAGTAVSRARALFWHSRNSSSGTLSATMPAPAWTDAWLPRITMVRMAMAVSTLPEKSM
ncbi:MAG: phosphatase PAP2 family protein [Actinomycetia bacterium]|nr:phosphatase PAP2 family protein [Actinomycetes bacterium]